MTDALIIIDMQRWMFRTPERAVQLPVLVSNVNRLASAYSVAGRPIIDVRTYLKADRSNWTRLMQKHDYACMIENTEDVEPVDGLEIPESAHRISKTRHNAFLKTNLEELLQSLEVSTLVMCGVFMAACIALTASDAEQLNYETVLVKDAIGHTNEHKGEFVFDWLDAMYELTGTTVDDVVSELEA